MLGLEFSLSHFWIKPNFYSKFHTRGFFLSLRIKLCRRYNLTLNNFCLECYKFLAGSFFGILRISGGEKINHIRRFGEFTFRKFRKHFLSRDPLRSDPQKCVRLKTEQDFHCDYNSRLLQTRPGRDAYKESWQVASHRLGKV